MRGLRITVLLFAFGAAAVAVAGIRVEQTRCIQRIQRMRVHEVRLHGELRKLELQIARLRSPGQIEERIDRFQLPVTDPHASLQQS